MDRQLKLFVPSHSSRLFPQVVKFMCSKGFRIEIEGKMLFLKLDYLDIYFARGFDIPKIIEVNWGDLGITGIDTCEELQVEVTLLKKLGIRYSNIVLASTRLKDINELRSGDLIVSEYPNITKKYFQNKHIQNLHFFYVTGSAETFGWTPEVAAIVTLKTSGRTLHDNCFNILDTIYNSQVCLISNHTSLENKRPFIERFIRSLEKINRGES